MTAWFVRLISLLDNPRTNGIKGQADIIDAVTL